MDDDVFDQDDDGMMNEDDFGEANFVDRFKQDLRKTPLITRTFFQVSVPDISQSFFLVNLQKNRRVL